MLGIAGPVSEIPGYVGCLGLQDRRKPIGTRDSGFDQQIRDDDDLISRLRQENGPGLLDPLKGANPGDPTLLWRVDAAEDMAGRVKYL